ncbi:hypothetical protein DFJ73DRAFT_765501 [Zopfochytrium polystomum]|nr:hypothetical protein DFJ73DRAFT_765501 [Zopfochytrium polystomum]
MALSLPLVLVGRYSCLLVVGVDVIVCVGCCDGSRRRSVPSFERKQAEQKRGEQSESERQADRRRGESRINLLEKGGFKARETEGHGKVTRQTGEIFFHWKGQKGRKIKKKQTKTDKGRLHRRLSAVCKKKKIKIWL